GTRPGKNPPRVKSLPAECVIAGAEGAAQDNGDLRNYAVGDRVNQLGAGPDNTGCFRLLSDHEAVDILEKENRNAALIAIHYESRRLVGAINVNHAAILKRSLRRAA